MKRRDFITFVGGAVVSWPMSASAQLPKPARQIGMLIASEENEPLVRSRVAAFRQGLNDLGWVEGGNLQILYRWTGNDPERTQRCVSELVALAPEVILSHSPPSCGFSVVGVWPPAFRECELMRPRVRAT